MFSRDTWFEIFSTVRKNKLRTFLSGFTVALGIFIFIVLFGFGNGLKNQFKEFFLDDVHFTPKGSLNVANELYDCIKKF